MSVITFVNNKKEETGKTMSLVAIATYMAINYNEKILIISTTNREEKIKSCFFEDEETKKISLSVKALEIEKRNEAADVEDSEEE